jgi:RimJ/RimL family protein N-acetyltransferase
VSVIETSRLLMRPPVELDFDAWAEFDADENATRFFGGPKGRAVAWEMFATNAGMWTLRGCGLFSVFEKQSGNWIGRVGPWKPEGATAEIGWAILPSYWGCGFATEAAEAAIGWTIRNLQWQQINHCIDADNSASIAVAARLGSRWLRSTEDAQGKPTQVYGQDAGDWMAQTRASPN